MSDAVRRDPAAVNARDAEGMLAELTRDVTHQVNEGVVRIGCDRFAAVLVRMNRCNREDQSDPAKLGSGEGARAAAEITVRGTSLGTDPGLPEAFRQTCRLPAAAFFTLEGDRIARVTANPNRDDWRRQDGP